VDGYAITVRRLPGAPLPKALPESPGVAALPRSGRLHIVRRAGRLALNCLFVAMLTSVLVVLGPALLGFHRYVILTGSMTGTYDRGAIVFDRPTPVSSLRVGNVITYSPPHGYTSQQRITHRIWWIGRGPGGERVFMTKGDANNKPDAWKFTLNQAMQDRVLFHVPVVGFLFTLLSLRDFRIALIGLPALVIGLLILRALWREAGAEARRQKLAELGWQEIADSAGSAALPPVDAPCASPVPVVLDLHLLRIPAAPSPPTGRTSHPAAAPAGLHVRRLASHLPARRDRGHAEQAREERARRASGSVPGITLRVGRLRSASNSKAP